VFHVPRVRALVSAQLSRRSCRRVFVLRSYVGSPSEKNHVAYGLASAYSIGAVRVDHMHAITFSFVDQSSSRGLEKFDENIPTSLEVIEAHTLNFKPNFKLINYFFWGGDPRPSSGVR